MARGRDRVSVEWPIASKVERLQEPPLAQKGLSVGKNTATGSGDELRVTGARTESHSEPVSVEDVLKGSLAASAGRLLLWGK